MMHVCKKYGTKARNIGNGFKILNENVNKRNSVRISLLYDLTKKIICIKT